MRVYSSFPTDVQKIRKLQPTEGYFSNSRQMLVLGKGRLGTLVEVDDTWPAYRDGNNNSWMFFAPGSPDLSLYEPYTFEEVEAMLQEKGYIDISERSTGDWRRIISVHNDYDTYYVKISWHDGYIITSGMLFNYYTFRYGGPFGKLK